MHWRSSLLAVAAGTLFAAPARAQQTQTVEVERCEAVGELSLPEARQRAIDNARVEAVRQVSGTRLQGVQTRVTEDLQQTYRNVVLASAEGRVVADTLLVNRLHTEDGLGGQQRVCWQVHMRATVATEEGKGDPNFRLEAGLVPNRDVLFYRGANAKNDVIVIRGTSTVDGYLTLVNVIGDSANVLFPNELMTENVVRANEAFEFPSKEWQRKGASLEATVPEGQQRSREMMILVVTREPITFPGEARPAEPGAVPTIPVSVNSLQGWLARIPRRDRAEAIVTYEVRRVDP